MGRPLSLATWLLLLLPLLLSTSPADAQATVGLPEQYLGRPAYWGGGWEDPVSKITVYRALQVNVDAVSALTISANDLNDEFDWRAYEGGLNQFVGGGGTSRVRGAEGFSPQPLQSWEPREDAVRHGYFMLYRFDNNVTTLDRQMDEYFFSITLDVNVHPDYGAHYAEGLNSSVRFTLYEDLPVDLSSPESELNMINGYSNSSTVLTGGNSWDVGSRRHRMMWGFDNDGHGVLGPQCARPARRLYLGIQCLQGYAFPAGSCTPDVTSAPTLDDCSSYCPFTLTVRAIPRVLHDGDVVPSLLGPGQWQAFELDAGPYDLVEATIDRREYDRAANGLPWQDGLIGRAWLSQGACIRQANLSVSEAQGYCPQGGELYYSPSTGDVPPHRFCCARHVHVHVAPCACARAAPSALLCAACACACRPMCICTCRPIGSAVRGRVATRARVPCRARACLRVLTDGC